MAEVQIQLDSSDWFWMTGHGPVCTIERSAWPFDPARLVGQDIEVDRKRFRVRGVERAGQWSPGKVDAIGLLVSALDDEPSNGRFNRSKSHTYETLMAEHGGPPPKLPQDIADYLCAMAGGDPSGVGIELIKKYLPGVVHDPDS